MRNTRFITIGLLSIFLLILTGGFAYAASTGSSHNPAQPAAAAVAGSHSQHPASQLRHGYQRHGGHWCDWQGYGHQRGTGHHAYQGQGHQGHGSQGYRHHGSGQGSRGYQGNWGYQGHGSHGGQRWGGGHGCCGSRWH